MSFQQGPTSNCESIGIAIDEREGSINSHDEASEVGAEQVRGCGENKLPKSHIDTWCCEECLEMFNVETRERQFEIQHCSSRRK